jgi:molybdenum cofactor biosynthesis enzyme MoaA
MTEQQPVVGSEPHRRSPVPDLLFEDVRDDRVAEILPYLDHPTAVDRRTPLHRVTVFLTYRCNLACPYCKTIARTEEELQVFPQKRVSFSYAAFQELLVRLDPAPIRHLHFTGGEATLVRDLPQMVCLAKARGVAHVSITSNGTLPQRIYQALIANGMDEIRISLDAQDAALGAALTGRAGAWRSAVETIRGIAALRDSGMPVFLIINTVVNQRNRRELVEIVRFMLALGPHDIKLITEVQQRDVLGNFAEARAQLQAIDELLGGYAADAFPLLRRKLRTIFASDAIGLAGVTAPAEKRWQCYIPLTERTVDGVAYYPCSVYLREGGRPLGPLSDSIEVQRERTAAFVQEHDCLADPICHQYCLHCTREYNIAANEGRR